MRSMIAVAAVAMLTSAASAYAQETSLGWYEDNWEATTFPVEGGWECSVDSLADNYPDFANTWVFVFPTYLQFSPNEGLPIDGVGRVSVDDSAAFDMTVVDGQVGWVADEDDLPLLQAIAQGSSMLIEVWPERAPQDVVQYVYSLNGFREAYMRIASECAFDPSPVLDAGGQTATTEPAEPESEGSSLFGRNKGK